MSTKKLPAHPDLRHLDLQAKTLLESARSGDQTAAERIQCQQPKALAKYSLSAARHALAREYGFDSWANLKTHVAQAGQDFHEKLDQFLDAAWLWGDRTRASTLVDENPEIVNGSIHAAAAYGHHVVLAKLLQVDRKLATKTGGNRKWVPLLYATWSCFWGDRDSDLLQVIRLLLEHGADPNCSWKNRDYDVRESALYGTVEANSVAGARLLLEAGANPNDGESLYHACEKGNLDLLTVLGDHGLRKEDISYCIKHAMDMRWDDGVKWFLDHGADPNAVHPAANETSLHWAVKRGAPLETIQALLDARANPSARTKAGRSAYLGLKGSTPLDFALRLGATETAALLRKHDATETSPSAVDAFVCAAAAGDRQRVEILLASQDDLLLALDESDRNLVALVAQMQNWAGMRLMIELGWPIDAVGWMKARPLTWALCFGASDPVDFLLTRGASLEPAGDYFRTPLHTVVHCRWERGDHAACLRRLLRENIAIPEGFYPCGQEELDDVLSAHLA